MIARKLNIGPKMEEEKTNEEEATEEETSDSNERENK